jgi:hypothetical protein
MLFIIGLTGPPSGPGTVLRTVPYIFLTEKYRTLWPGTMLFITGPQSGPGLCNEPGVFPLGHLYKCPSHAFFMGYWRGVVYVYSHYIKLPQEG